MAQDYIPGWPGTRKHRLVVRTNTTKIETRQTRVFACTQTRVYGFENGRVTRVAFPSPDAGKKLGNRRRLRARWTCLTERLTARSSAMTRCTTA